MTPESAAVLIPDLVTDTGSLPATIPVANAASLQRLDDAVATIDRQAQEYLCVTAADYIEGGKAVVRIRELEHLYGGIFAPVKKWWHARHAEACADENARVGRLGTAKTRYGAAMIAWKAAEELREAEARKVREAAEQRRAEDARLEQAQRLQDRATAQGNPQLAARALDLLDRPLDVAPTVLQSVVPKLVGVKVVGRQEITITDPRAFLIAVGMTLAAEATVDPAARAPYAAYYCKPLADLLENPEHVAKITKGFADYLKALKSARGDSFSVPGVDTGKKSQLG